MSRTAPAKVPDALDKNDVAVHLQTDLRLIIAYCEQLDDLIVCEQRDGSEELSTYITKLFERTWKKMRSIAHRRGITTS